MDAHGHYRNQISNIGYTVIIDIKVITRSLYTSNIKDRVVFTTGITKLLCIWEKALLYIHEWMHTAIHV